MLSPVDEIKNRLDIVDVVSEYIKLKQAGVNYKAPCPFHKEKTPSFMVSRDKQIWHCFGCGEGGDIFGFVMRMEGVEFPEALRILANKAGVQLKKQDPALYNQKTKLLDLLAEATKFYHRLLLESPQAQKALDYLLNRKITKETIEEFQIGYAPDGWEITKQYLEQKGYRENDIFLAGLLVKKEETKSLYDRFRDRIMFPIRDIHGNVVGFSGRAMKSEEEAGAKYINTPQSMVFDKGRLLFNLDKAKIDIRKLGYAIVAEGQMDVISSYQAGIKNIIASSGTALTSDQIKLLKRYTNNLALCFDMDEAGQIAAKRAIDASLNQSMNIKVIVIPEEFGKDPDECINKNPENWKKAIKDSLYLIDYFIQKAKKDYDLTNVNQKTKAINEVLEVLGKIQDPVEQSNWMQKIFDQFEVPEQVLRERLRQYKSKAPEIKQDDSAYKKVVRSKNQILSERIIALALKFSPNLSFIIDNLSTDMIKQEELKELYNQIVSYYTKSSKKDLITDDFLRILEENQQIKKNAQTLLLMAEREFLDFTQKDFENEAKKTIRLIKQDFYTNQLKDLEKGIKEAEKVSDKNEIERLLKKFGKISLQLKDL